MDHALSVWTESLFRSHVLFASQDVDETRTKVAELLNDHVLEPRGSTLAACAYGIIADSLSIYMLEYGGAVLIEETQPAGDFLLVQMVLSGSLNVECPEGNWAIRPGDGLILPSDVPHRLSWGASATHMILKVPVNRLNAAYSDLTGVYPDQPIKFNRQIALNSVDGRQWNAQMRYLCEQVVQCSQLDLFKVKMAEDALMRHLLCAQSTSLRQHFTGRPAALAPRHVRRAREFIESHLHEDVCLTRIAEHSGVSTRNLSRTFQTQYDMSPMQYLRGRRLDEIRQALLNASPDVRVSDVAMQWGYTHLSRFAAVYRQRFGETPKETLKPVRPHLHRKTSLLL